jgi:Zn-dependent protease
VLEVLETYLIVWRTIALRDREVIDALVDPSHSAPSPQLAAALAQWPGTYYWSDETDGRHLVLTRPTDKPAPEAWWLHVLLLVATVLCTTYAGAVFRDALPPSVMYFWSGLLALDREFLGKLVQGLTFSVPLVGILLAHELGHYFTARRYKLDTSPPFFIPIPFFPGWFIGTLGAFIRLRTILSDRRQLLDVGIAGPIAGFLIAVPVFWLGLRHSIPLPPGHHLEGLVVHLGVPVEVGHSLVTLGVQQLAGMAGQSLVLHPIAFAGWFGIFVTMLNMLPIAQLDGGHILYAAAPRWHARVAVVFWGILALLGFVWLGWGIWAVLILLLSRGQLRHPPVLDGYRPLPSGRRWLLLAALILFVVTFAPMPFKVEPIGF